MSVITPPFSRIQRKPLDFQNSNSTFIGSILGSTGTTTQYGDGSNLTDVGAAAASALTVSGKAAENINKGQPVWVSGATGQFPQFSLAVNNSSGSAHVIGLAAETKTSGQTILVRVGGQLTNVNTSDWSDGDALYLSSTIGTLTNTEPTSGRIEHIADVEYSHASTGKLLVHTDNVVQPYIAVASGEDIDIRMGDTAGSNTIKFENYNDTLIGSINSTGTLDLPTIGTATSTFDGVINTGAQAQAINFSSASGTFAGLIDASKLYTGTIPSARVPVGLALNWTNANSTYTGDGTNITGISVGAAITGGTIGGGTIDGAYAYNFTSASGTFTGLPNGAKIGATTSTLYGDASQMTGVTVSDGAITTAKLASTLNLSSRTIIKNIATEANGATFYSVSGTIKTVGVSVYTDEYTAITNADATISGSVTYTLSTGNIKIINGYVKSVATHADGTTFTGIGAQSAVVTSGKIWIAGFSDSLVQASTNAAYFLQTVSGAYGSTYLNGVGTDTLLTGSSTNFVGTGGSTISIIRNAGTNVLFQKPPGTTVATNTTNLPTETLNVLLFINDTTQNVQWKTLSVS